MVVWHEGQLTLTGLCVVPMVNWDEQLVQPYFIGPADAGSPAGIWYCC